jgi:hypothetical protein
MEMDKTTEQMMARLLATIRASHKKDDGRDESRPQADDGRHEGLAKRDGGPSRKMEIESIVVHEEVPKHEAAVKTVRALKKRHGGRHVAVRICGQPKEWTQGPRRSWLPPVET